METLSTAIGYINGLVWGWPMLVLILGTGAYLMLGLRLMPLRYIPAAFGLLLSRSSAERGKGEISAFQALMTSLSATIGTGNIAGVATAIALGGPGALFWMWCTALVGMATKYAEAVCAVEFRERDSDGNLSGGPMYYIRNGLGPKWRWLAGTFAFFGIFAGFGIGNTVQANSVADALQSTFSVPMWVDWRGAGGLCGVGRAGRREANCQCSRCAGAVYGDQLHGAGPDYSCDEPWAYSGHAHAGAGLRFWWRGLPSAALPERVSLRRSATGWRGEYFRMKPDWAVRPLPTRRRIPTAPCARASSLCWGRLSTPCWCAA